jgi:anti-sigma B factor antagonist
VGLSSHLSLDTRRVGDAAIVAVRGDIDLTTTADAEAALDAARRGVSLLMLDLRAVGFMDTSGLRLVISEQQRAEAGGYRFTVVPGEGKVQRLFEIAGFPPGDALFADAPAGPVSGGGA